MADEAFDESLLQDPAQRKLIRAQARDALFTAGHLEPMLHAGQVEALRMFERVEARRVVLNIARRWGKTWFACVVSFIICLRKPKSRVAYAAPTGRAVREFAMPHFHKIAAWALPENRPDILAEEVRFKNGSRIVLSGCEDEHKADRLRGPAADAVIIDEAGFIPVLNYAVRSVLLPQLITTNGKMLMVSTPPLTPAHPFRLFAAEAEQRGAYMQRTLYTAPHISKEQVDAYAMEVGGHDSVDWRREGLAEFLVDPTLALVPEFSTVEKEIVEVRDLPTHYDRYVVCDLGYVDLTFIVFAIYDFLAGVMYVVDELVLERTTSDGIQREVARKERELWGAEKVYRRYIDAPAITRADMSRLQEEPELARRWQPVHNQDRDALVNALRLAVGRKKLRIHPKCKGLITHLRHGVWNTKRTEFARSEEKMGHWDGVAAAMYLVRHVDKSRNPFPPGEYNVYEQHVPAELQIAPTEEMRRAEQMRSIVRRKRKR